MSDLYFMLQNTVSNLNQNYFKNAFYSEKIHIPPLIQRAYHLIMSYKFAIISV